MPSRGSGEMLCFFLPCSWSVSLGSLLAALSLEQGIICVSPFASHHLLQLSSHHKRNRWKGSLNSALVSTYTSESQVPLWVHIDIFLGCQIPSNTWGWWAIPAPHPQLHEIEIMYFVSISVTV